jgi:hypothetical protein
MVSISTINVNPGLTEIQQGFGLDFDHKKDTNPQQHKCVTPAAIKGT